MFDVLAGYVWWCYAILHFGVIIFGILVLFVGAEDRAIIAVWCGFAASLFAGLMKLTEKVPLAGIIIYALLMIHFVVWLYHRGQDKKDR